MTLPVPVTTVDGFDRVRRLAELFASTRESPHTRAAYRADLTGCGYPLDQCAHRWPERHHRPTAWLPWCHARNIDPVGEIRAAIIERWLTDLATRPNGERRDSDGTRARRLASLSAFYGWLLRERVVAENPVAQLHAKNKPKMRRPGTAGTALSEREAAALLHAADTDGPRSSALVALILFGGPRIAEALTATVADLSTSDGMHILTVTGKGRRHRIIPLPPPVWRRLDAYLATRADAQPEVLPALGPGARQPAPLFATGRGTPLDRNNAAKLLARLAASVGIARLTPHDLRRSFATLSLKDGASIEDVQDAMGHANIDTTRGYDRRKFDVMRHPAHRLAAHLSRFES